MKEVTCRVSYPAVHSSELLAAISRRNALVSLPLPLAFHIAFVRIVRSVLTATYKAKIFVPCEQETANPLAA